jgi:signal transduction histidine kinase
MLAEILLGVLVLAVAILVTVDFSRTKSESSHGQADEQAYDARPRAIGDSRGGRPEAFLREPAGTGIPAAMREADQARRPESISPSAGGPQPARISQPVRETSRRELKDWPVRSRLWLLVVISAVAVTAVAFCVVRIAGVLHGAQIHSASSSVRDRAIVSVLVVGVVIIVVLALALWSMVAVARSVLRPLYRLRAGALEMAQVRLPDEIRRISENNGDGVSSDVEPIEVNSSDEIGEVAHAFNQMRSETLRLAANEAGLQGKLDGMFVNLSHRSQSLVERQIRLIENLEQGEQDRQRQASLLKMSRIASRMHRNSQNLLILAGHEISSGWSQPIALVNVIRAAVSEIEDYERVSLNAQPEIAVRGPAVNDVVHLVAELIENATSFSAGDMPVDISGRLLTSGGVLVEITDRGVGMAPKELAYANWRLENPPAADINVPKWIGLFVVARLAVRHGIRVRLQQAEFGGLTALVWLPDELITHQGAAASPRPGGFGSLGSRPGLHEAVVDSGHATAEQRVTAGRSPQFVPSREDGLDAPLARRLISDEDRRPGPTGSASRPRPGFQAEAPVAVKLSGSEAPDGMGEPAAVLSSGAGLLSGSGLSAPGRSEMSQFARTSVGSAAPSSQEKSSAEGGVIVPPLESPAEQGRLPIYDSVESRWFTGGREVSTSPGPTAAGRRWSSPADEGAHAAQTVESPSSGGQTSSGLPKRLPNANLVPGAIPSTESTESVVPHRSAAAARDRLAGLQRGVSQARDAASEAPSPGGEDES